MDTSMGIRHAKPYTIRGGPSTKLEQSMTNGREMTPPLGFSTPPQIPNNTTSERPLVTTTVFAATTLENTLFAYHASTSTNPNPMISPDFVEANYEILDYDEEREMEPRTDPRREATSALRLRSHVVRRQRQRVVGFEDAPNREGNKRGRNAEGFRPLEIEARKGSFVDSTGFVTLFVRWIEDYPLPDRLKMPSHIGSYDGKGDPDNFLHLFEGAIRMQKWLMPVACHMFTYTLKDSARIWWNISKLNSQRHIWRFTTSNKEKEKALEPSSPNIQMIPCKSWVYIKNNESLASFMQERQPLMVPQVIEETVSKGQRKVPRIIIEERETKTDSPPIRDLIMVCSPVCQKAEGNSRYGEDYKKFQATSEDVWNKKDKGTAPAEAIVLMVSREVHTVKSLAQENTDYEGKKIIFPPIAKVNNAPVIIESKIFKRKVGRVYMDSESSCEIIYEHCFEKLNPTIKATKVDLKTPLVGFSGERSWFNGKVSLEINIGDAPLSRTKTLNFVIVRSDSSHNMLLGRTMMQRMGIVVSTIHGAIKFHIKKGIGTVLSTDEADEGTKRARKIPSINKERVLRIPRTIMVEGKPFNMENKLNEYNHVKPIKQNKRGLGPDRNMASCKEIEELTKAGILRKFKHQTWVANPVMVKKSDGGWRMCVDFTNINKACPKDCYPLPETDWKIESLSGFQEDEDKTAFYTEEGVFCYKKMPFGLKNAGAIYQRLVDKVFSHQIGRNLKAYVDDMVIKSTSEKEMLKDIQETFERNEKETPADFLVEIPFEDNEKKEKPKELPDSNSKWRVYTDGASNSDRFGAGLMLIDPKGLQIAEEMEIAKVAIILDSQLLVNQIKGTFAAKQTSIKDYLQKVKTALRGFEEYTVEHV
ncbi:reverse transcriptase domain-containing protein [Tanacetum coccineum]